MTKQLIELLELFKKGESSDREKQMLLDELTLNEQSLKVWLESGYEKDIAEKITIISKERSDEVFRQIQLSKVTASQRISTLRIIRLSKRWILWAAAACIIGILATGIFYVGRDDNDKQLLATAKPVKNLKQALNNTNDLSFKTDKGIIVITK